VAPFLRDFQAGRGRKIALTLVEFRGNAIATSQEGEGSTFAFALPTRPVPEA